MRPACRRAFCTGRPIRHCVTNGCKAHAFFRFGKGGDDAEKAGVYGNLTRDDFDFVEMEQYFNYTGRLAVEQNYDSYNKYKGSGVHPVDVILFWAAEEGDLPKVEEVLRAGADPTVKDLNGKTALELAKDPDTRQAIEAALATSA
jgi:hypothetical protein